jgi:hypothetical protein
MLKLLNNCAISKQEERACMLIQLPKSTAKRTKNKQKTASKIASKCGLRMGREKLSKITHLKSS